MKTKFYWESVGESVSQVYEIEANDWEDAKKKAFKHMCEGDILAECTEDAVKEHSRWSEYHYIDLDECIQYTKLCRGMYFHRPNGDEYWEDDVWYFGDEGSDSTCLHKNDFFNEGGEIFAEYRGDLVYCAILEPNGTTDMDGNAVEWSWNESYECDYSDEWNGDVLGYANNAIAMGYCIEDNMEVMTIYNGAIHNLPENAVIVGENGIPKEIYFIR